jgi:hypothetical protein
VIAINTEVAAAPFLVPEQLGSPLPPEPLRLLWQHQTTGSTVRWEVESTGRLARWEVLPTPGPNWLLAGSGDFDRDGQADQIWRQRLTGENQLWRSVNSGNGVAIVNLPMVVDPLWQIEGVADFNHDQQLDLVWRHPGSGENLVWLMAAGQPHQAIQSIVKLLTVADPQWQIGGIADFNQDGQVDVLWRHQQTGVNLVWLMQGTKIADHWMLPELRDPAWQISGTADVNWDGQTDLLWWHQSAGANVAWLMQGAKLSQKLSLATLPDTGWRLAAIAPTSQVMAQAIAKAAALAPLVTPPASQFVLPVASDLPQVDFAITSLVTVDPVKPVLAVANDRALPVSVQFSHQGAAIERAKLSFWLSEDAVISRRDRFLGAVTTAVVPNQLGTVSQSLQLPPVDDEFWQGARPKGLDTFYLGVVIEGLDSAPEADRANNTSSLSVRIQLPLLQSYDFVYDYSDVTDWRTANPPPLSDFYRGTVIAPDGTYQVGQVVDVLADRNQSGRNGRYQITATKPYSGTQTAGWVEVVEYFDRETAQRYQPIGAVGQDYLGSESGYIQPRQSNTDRFGADFYEADVWRMPPVAPGVGVAPRSSNETIQSLINPFFSYWDTRQNGGVITYSFYQDTGLPYVGPEMVTSVSEGIKRNVRRIFADLERWLPVRFVEVAETTTTVGAIRYLLSEGEGDPFYAYTYYPGRTIGGDVHLSRAVADADETGFAAAAGSYGYRAILHETLHALGLKHPGNYDAGAGYSPPPFLAPATDNSTNTIMSYNTAGFYEMTPMVYDLQALQYLYGAAATAESATVYDFTTLTDYRVGKIEFGDRQRATKQTIRDSGGEDTLDFSRLGIVRDHRFDLRPGGFLTAQAAYNSQSYRDLATQQQFFTSEYGVALSSETLIENLVNSIGNDFMIANTAANKFLGYRLGRRSGNDVIAQSDVADRVVLQDYVLADLSVAVRDDELLIRLAGDGTLRILDYFQRPLDLQLNGQSYRYDRSRGWVAKNTTVTVA